MTPRPLLTLILGTSCWLQKLALPGPALTQVWTGQSGEKPGNQLVLSCCKADPKPALARALSVAKATLEVLGGGWGQVSPPVFTFRS